MPKDAKTIVSVSWDEFFENWILRYLAEAFQGIY
jgi:hypothetical protein